MPTFTELESLCRELSCESIALLATLDFVLSAYGNNEDALNHWTYYYYGMNASALYDNVMGECDE